nr:Dullard phosphatase domain, eukaryotic [Tanacetum cinerariifolium]
MTNTLQPKNGIPIKRFIDDLHDDELKKLMDNFFKSCDKYEDLKDALKHYRDLNLKLRFKLIGNKLSINTLHELRRGTLKLSLPLKKLETEDFLTIEEKLALENENEIERRDLEALSRFELHRERRAFEQFWLGIQHWNTYGFS